MFLNLSTGILAGTLALASNPGLFGWVGFAACVTLAIAAPND